MFAHMTIDLLNVRAWAMEPRFFDRAFPVVYEMLARGHDISFLQKASGLFPAISSRDPKSRAPIAKSKNGANVAIMSISGGLTKSGDLCAYGMRDYAFQLQRLNESDNVDAILIEMDTPGGSVDGTPELAEAVKASQKPVVVFGDGMVASAGMWIASQADVIIANSKNYTEFGSIGTLFVYPNYENVINAGRFPTVRVIRAPQSKDKALTNMFEPLSKEQEAEILSDLENITNDFINSVKAGREGKLLTGSENVFTGKMYSAEKAMELGLIDAIGTRIDAVEMAGALAEKTNQKTGPEPGQNAIHMNFKKLSALFRQAEGEAELTADERASLEAAEQQLEERDARIAELEGENEALRQENMALETTIENLNGRIGELEAELAAAPAGVATTAVSEEDHHDDDDPMSKYLTSVDLVVD